MSYYSANQFYHEFTGASSTDRRMHALARLCNLIGVKPGINADMQISIPYKSSWQVRTTHRISFNVNIKEMSPPSRRALKKFVKLEVPAYALGGTYKEPPLMGAVTIRFDTVHDGLTTPDDYREPRMDDGSFHPIIEIDFNVNGAYVCEKVGQQEKEPSEWERSQAGKLASMTDEEVLAKHRNEILDMLKPKLVDSYQCNSAVEGE
jgi:hypothetical protein